MGEWHDLVWKLDLLLLLVDVFENFRQLSLNSYPLDPTSYYTTPEEAWNCMLQYTNVELELLTDYDKYLFLKKA